MKNRLFWSLGASLTILALVGARMVVPAESTAPTSPEADVAEALGISVGTVKTLASRGLARLRTTATQEEEVAT